MRRTRATYEAMEAFKTQFIAALEDEEAVERIKLIFEPMFTDLLSPVTDRLSQAVQTLTGTVEQLRQENQAKDVRIQELEREVGHLHMRVYDLEQHGRRDSIRIFGLSETTQGTTDDKVLRLCNGRMNLAPPLALEEIAVSHRVGKPVVSNDAESPPPPRPLLVKFSTRRSRNRVMEARKSLKDPPSQDDVEYGAMMADGERIYMADDLTKRLASLAFRAREAKRSKQISDTWVIDTKIMVKDCQNRIKQIFSIDEMEKNKRANLM